MIEIKPQMINSGEINVPGSKSYTHRSLITAALSDSICIIQNALQSEDTRFTIAGLEQLGIKIHQAAESIVVHGTKGLFSPCRQPIYLGNSGTSMRFLTAVASLGKEIYTLTGSERMQQRPIMDLVYGLKQIGVNAHSIHHNGCPPVHVQGGPVIGGRIVLNCETSSQYLSALLLIAPYTEEGLDIHVTHGPVSKPYIDMTVDVMKQFGVDIRRDGYSRFIVPGRQVYRAGSFTVEPDASQAGYFWAAAAISGADIKVKGITPQSCQGDVHFTQLLEAMGCKIIAEKDGITVCGRPLTAIEADMADMPDMVPTLAVVAAFAEGTTYIRNVAHLKVKESDRLLSVATELSRIGISTTCNDSGLVIQGGKPHGAVIHTYGDHRIAMSFALIGLRIPGIFIEDESCVEKSFPDFWKVFEKLKKQ
ncbi:MAG: 3-phosphoshikimate 1-carboxyvinyltransferase [Desulfobacterales bacterium]|nr:3-phosphoshikimate 1-carboxyvinyltransferase [Desulfobacterales bacterium]